METVNVNRKRRESGTAAKRDADWVWVTAPDNFRGPRVDQESSEEHGWVWIMVPKGFRDFLANQDFSGHESEFDFLRENLRRFVAQCTEGIEVASKTLDLIGN